MRKKAAFIWRCPRCPRTIRLISFDFEQSVLRAVLNGPWGFDCAILFSGLLPEKSEQIAQLWRVHFVMLSRNMVDQSLVVNKVVDMEWRFGVSAASSELAQVGKTFLQLKLVVSLPL